MRLALLIIAGCLWAIPVCGQVPTGYVSALVASFPNRDNAAELRARAFVEEKVEVSHRLRLTLSGFAEALVADRGDEGTTTTVFRVQDANIELRARRLDLLAGFARVAWGTLDELQPTDVVNPLDVSRFFFEGRNEARMPVPLVRARIFIEGDTSVEAIYVPFYRRGRFDQLDEKTSPFSVTPDPGTGLVVCLAIGCPTLPPTVVTFEPDRQARNAQGGVRLTATTGRVDWSVAAFRGFEPFGLYTLMGVLPASPSVVRINQVFPRFTMIGGDFETVFGEWGIRGEGAVHTDDSFQSTDLRIVQGHSLEGGIGVDRKAGSYTLSGTVLVHHEAYDAPLRTPDGIRKDRNDVSLVVSGDRTFARERYRLRTFGVYTPNEHSAFVRGIGTASVRDNLVLEGSAGWFLGTGNDTVGRFSDSDFGYVRLKYFF
ncbi:MAG: hypothetical protein LC753_02875 [Acidobacteria bacterium]|nr:hypothetical protein [Acidobacteriota bacterium]MCA1649245.1 hypothetical protein [Acidobacteriota bacterium]